MKILAILTVLTLASVVLVEHQINDLDKYHGAEFVVRPIESHITIAAALLQSGDTLKIVRDGKKHYWHDELLLPSLGNITIRAELKLCSGCDFPDCDVVIRQPSIDQIGLH